MMIMLFFPRKRSNKTSNIVLFFKNMHMAVIWSKRMLSVQYQEDVSQIFSVLLEQTNQLCVTYIVVTERTHGLK